MPDTTETNPGLREEITDPNQELGDNNPGTPFMLVGLSYVVILAIVCIVIAAIVYFLR